MACCKCCCDNKDCAHGDKGKCCCGTTEKNCCTAEQYCCDGVCQSTPCTGACCDPTFGCTQTADEETCTDEGGEWLGLGIPCDPDPCSCAECNEGPAADPFGEVITKNVRPYDCGPYGNTASDTESPCDLYPPVFSACSTIAGIPEQYEDCECMTLVHQCTTFDYDLGVDENDNCCVATQQATTFRDYVYIFNEGLCQWRLVYEPAPLTIPSACSTSSQAPGCTAVCPDVRECSPGEGNDCLSTYAGCDCNEFP